VILYPIFLSKGYLIPFCKNIISIVFGEEPNLFPL
jgi:hypothetical protein